MRNLFSIPLGLNYFCRNNFKFQPLDPVTGSMILGAGTSLLNGLVSLKSNSTNKKLVRETNALQKEMFEKQMGQQASQFQQSMDFEKETWQRNRDAELSDWSRDAAYNTAAQQAERYRAAGLNPALMMQNGSAAIANGESVSGSSVSPGSLPSAPQLQTPRDTSAEAVSSAIDKFLNARSVESDSALKDAQKEQIQIDNRSRDQRNLVDLQLAKSKLIEYKDNHKLSDKQLKVLDRQIDMLDDQISVLGATFDARVKKAENENYATRAAADKVNEETQILKIQKEFTRRLEARKVRLLDWQIEGIVQDIVESKSRGKVNAANEAKIILEAYDIIPGSPQYKQAKRLVESEIVRNNRSKVGLPFGASFEMPAYHGTYKTQTSVLSDYE